VHGAEGVLVFHDVSAVDMLSDLHCRTSMVFYTVSEAFNWEGW
jgi:hypothetical protein